MLGADTNANVEHKWEDGILVFTMTRNTSLQHDYIKNGLHHAVYLQIVQARAGANTDTMTVLENILPCVEYSILGDDADMWSVRPDTAFHWDGNGRSKEDVQATVVQEIAVSGRKTTVTEKLDGYFEHCSQANLAVAIKTNGTDFTRAEVTMRARDPVTGKA